MAKWFNGGAKAHTLSHGLHYASLVFEEKGTMAVRFSKVMQHTGKLQQFLLNIMDFDLPISDDEVMQRSKRSRQMILLMAMRLLLARF